MGDLRTALPGVVPIALVVGVMMLSAEDMSRTAMILASCVGLCGFMAYLAIAEAPAKEGEPRQSILQRFLAGTPRKSMCLRSGDGDLVESELDNSDESVRDLVDKFRIEAAELRDSTKLLRHLHTKLRGDGPAAHGAAIVAFERGLLNSLFSFMQHLSSDDKHRMAVSANIVNELLSKNAVRLKIFDNNDHSCKNIIDHVISTVKCKAFPQSPQKATTETTQVVCNVSKADDNHESLLPPSRDVPNDIFPSYGYKLVMAVGLLCADSREAQTKTGDRGAIKVVVDILRTYGYMSADVVKWCCWSLIHLTFDHPPNKRELYQIGGIVHVIDSLQHFPKSVPVFEQALGLIINVLVYDSHTKMNQSQVRQAALANNIFNVLQNAQKEFKINESIQGMINQIFQILITDWS